MFYSTDIYEKYLSSIKNIKFTPREIDILACILSGKAAGVIATLLEVSIRTVETHMLNIRTKLGCSSRNGIIEYIEKSDELHILKTHYQNLLLEKAFEKALQKIQEQVGQNSPSIRLMMGGNASASFWENVAIYLKFMGIEVSSSRKKKGISSDGYMAVDCLVYGIGEETISQLHTKEAINNLQAHILSKNSIRTNHIIFAVLEGDQLPEALQQYEYVDFRNLNNLYCALLKLIQKILPYIRMDKIIDEYIEQYGRVKGPLKQDPVHNSILLKKETLMRKGISLDWWREFFTKTKVPLVSFIVFILIVMGFLLFRGSTLERYQYNRPISVRSDLIIPIESGLLRRPELLAEIKRKLGQKKGSQTVPLVGILGMGGVGKTILSRQFAQTQDASVVWEINAETEESLINSFKDLSYALAATKDEKEELSFLESIKDPMEKQKQLILFVKNRLKALPNWLLIYDNVNTFSDVRDYLPQDYKVWGNGKVIITTIDGNIQNTSYMNIDNIIQLGELTPPESLVLLIKILYNSSPDKISKGQREKALDFLKNIPPFPLDISVAAYYIKDTAITYEVYLERIGQYNKNFEESQGGLLKALSNYNKTRYEIITLSFKKLMEVNPHYKDLLLFICLLDSQYIPKDLLKIYKSSSIVDHFIHDLRHYSLINTESGIQGKQAKTLFSLHRATQSLGRKFILSLSTEAEIKTLLDKMITSIKYFDGAFSEKQSSNIIISVPHLEVFLNNLNMLPISEALKEKYRKEVMLTIGYAHLNGTRSYKLAEKNLSYVYQCERKNRTFSDYELAVILKDLGNIYGTLELYEKTIACAQESIKLLKKKDTKSEIVLIENLRNIGRVHADQNHFEEAKKYVNMALDKLSRLDAESSKELKADSYDLLTWLYSSRYITKHHTYDAINYALKALALVGGEQLFHMDPSQDIKKVSCSVAQHRTFLGYAYRRLGKYKEAMDQGFREAQYLIENTQDTCSHNFWNMKLDYGVGEVFLREGRLKLAEEKLTKAIKQSEILVGEYDAIGPKIFRVEARIRLNKLKEAYEDCKELFKVRKSHEACTKGLKWGKKTWSNYEQLLYITCSYHAALIKYKQKDLKKSAEYFCWFFAEVKAFCKHFLDAKAYQALEDKGSFKIVPYNLKSAKQDSQEYLKHSMDIFTAIYGASHLFVRDYIVVNYKEANKSWYQFW